MVSVAVKNFFREIVLVSALLFGGVIRPSLISLVYVLLALVGPLLAPINKHYPSVSIPIKIYLILTTIVSVGFAIAQCVYQCYEVINTPNIEDYTRDCANSTLHFWMRQIGFVRVKGGVGLDTIRVIAPEILSSLSSLITAIICLILSHQNDNLQYQHIGNMDSSGANISQVHPVTGSPRATVQQQQQEQSGVSKSLKFVNALVVALKRLGDVAIILFIGLVGIIQPSILNSMYFISFLFVVTWWSSYTPFHRRCNNSIKRVLILYSAVHFILIYIYQIPFIQHAIPSDWFVARLIGFASIVENECPEWWALKVVWIRDPNQWTSIVNAALILVLYYTLIIQYKYSRGGVLRSMRYVATSESSIHEDLLVDGEEVDGGDGGAAAVESVQLQPITSTVIDRQKIASIFRDENGDGSAPSEGLVSILSFCLYHGYMLASLSMLIWGLLYHSIFGLIFLITALISFAFKDARSVAFATSPVLLFYAEFLLVAQYICSMDISKEIAKSDLLEMVGFVMAEDRVAAFVTLLVKGILCLPLFILLRLHLREKFYNSLSDRDRRKQIASYGTFRSIYNSNGSSNQSGNLNESGGTEAVSWFSDLLVKYWIFVVAVVLLLVSVQSPPLCYTIGYFLFFALLLTFLQISFGCFRKTLFAYWTLLVIYSSLVLLAIYCFQFPGIPEYWFRLTGLSKQWTDDIGLINYKDEKRDSTILFVRLFAPVSFCIVAMLQLKFFHSPWSKMVSTANSNTQQTGGALVQGEGANEERNRNGYEKMKALFDSCVELLWRLAEVHITKLVMLILIIIVVNDICEMNVVIVLFVSIAICMPAFSTLISALLCIYLSIFALARMIYQLHFINENRTDYIYLPEEECNISGINMIPFSEWLGFHKVFDIGQYIAGLIMALIALSIQAIVIYRQRHKRSRVNATIPKRGIVFEDFDCKDWDASLVNACKFAFNYTFYRFGLEISMIMMAVVAWVRMDLIGTLTLIWLIVFVCISRNASRRIWPLFLIYLAVLLPLQYQVYVGLPPELCIEYPWSRWLSNSIQNENFVLWLDLASYRIHPNPYNTIADFFLLLIVSCQQYAFYAEYHNFYLIGDNESVYKTKDYNIAANNPHYDFITHQRSFVDVLKLAIFNYGHWATLVMVLIAGLGGVSLFALGYIVLAFWLLWQGNALYIRKRYEVTLRQWKILLIYIVLTMFCKVILQVVGCAFIHLLKEHHLCYVRQLFSIVCVNKALDGTENYYFDGQLEFDNTCTVQKSETQIGFDTFAFAFLVFQMRILHSWYFQHCMIDYRSEAVLINRGAILTNQLIAKEMKEQNQQQSRKFEEIKRRTAKIRERYEEQLQYGGSANAFIPQTYGQGYSPLDEDDPCPGYDPRFIQLIPAKRAGDYYMFEYDPNTDELVKPISTFVPEVTPGAGRFDRLDPAQLLHTAVQHDLDLSGTLNAVECAEKIENEEKRMIAAVSDQDHQHDDGENIILDETQADGGDQAVETAETDGQKSILCKVMLCLRFTWKLVLSALDWTAAFMNRRSRDHRYVAYVLNKEKEILKRSLREPLIDVKQSVSGVREEFERSNLHCVSSETDIEVLENEALEAWQERDVLTRLVTSLGHVIAAHTDIICYVFVIIDQARSAGLLSLPLPLLVFFWGSLSNPRPTKIFWIVMISYTQLIVIIKFICQFGFFPWNVTSTTIKLANSPKFLPGILGIRKEEFYAFWDIVLLVALFFHRYMLRKMGLWDNASSVPDTFFEQVSIESSTAIKDSEQDENGAQHGQVAIVNNNGTGNGMGTEGEVKEGGASKKRGFLSELFYRLFHPKYRYIRDLYPFMFLVDVLCFFVVSFGYSSFGYGGSGSVVKDISSNRVPITFVVMLIVISVMIVIDRALYLRKAVLCKLIYQFITIIFLHVWIFFVLPTITYQAAWLNKTAQFLYFVKCVYLLISAWQIRNGYPSLCIGNLITHAYGLANMVFFKAFMAIPFLFEVRTAIDWTWIDTSMPLFDFFNMENFYATIYNLKCARTFEQNFPAPRGVAKGVVVKYLMGIPMILILILVIWLPLLAFSLLNRIGLSLIPDNVQMTISVEGYPPLYSMEAQGIELVMLNESEYLHIQNAFAERFNSSNQNSILRARQAVAFINEYTVEDMLKVRFRPESEKFWSISSDALTAMKYELQEGTKTINAIVKLQFVRPRSGDKKEPTVHSSMITIPLQKDSVTRNSLIALLDGATSNTSVTLKNSLPPYVIVPNEGEIKAPPALLAVMHGSSLFSRVDETYSDLVMKLKPNNQLTDMLWSVELDEDNVTKALTLPLDHVKYGDDHSLQYVQMVAFVDRVFPSFVTKYVQGGIIAMYLAVVLLVGRLIRGIVTNAPLDVIISEIPNPDYLLKICLDIYLVREAKDFVLEQDLFAKLIFLFRSPATLIKWTRFKAKTD